jgi:glycosyltransferase involved in cell wall biosynthesis
VEVVRLLHHWGISVDVVFAGRADQPEYELALRKRISSTGLSDCFHFFGLLKPDQLRDVYAVSAVLAFPTYHQEGLPRILLEAQAMELPVVVYDSGGSRAGLLADKTGFLIAPGDVHKFAQAIRRILQDSTLAKSFALAGRKFIEAQFGLKALGDRHERFIANTVMHGRSHRD